MIDRHQGTRDYHKMFTAEEVDGLMNCFGPHHDCAGTATTPPGVTCPTLTHQARM